MSAELPYYADVRQHNGAHMLQTDRQTDRRTEEQDSQCSLLGRPKSLHNNVTNVAWLLRGIKMNPIATVLKNVIKLIHISVLQHEYAKEDKKRNNLKEDPGMQNERETRKGTVK